MDCCNAERRSISTQSKEHKFCHNCRSHLYKGQLINAEDWLNWIEYGEDGEPFKDFIRRTKY